MQEEEKRLKAEIEALLRTAEAADENEETEHGPDDDGYRLSEELARREDRLAKIDEAKAALGAREGRDNPGEPIDPKKQISFADDDARCHSKKSDGTWYVYNAQAAVDMESQIIVGDHIEDSVQDAHAAEPAQKKYGAGPRRIAGPSCRRLGVWEQRHAQDLPGAQGDPGMRDGAGRQGREGAHARCDEL